MTELAITDVVAVELLTSFQSNSGCRRIRITTSKGEVTIALWGDTAAVDALPRAADFADYDQRRVQATTLRAA